MYPQKRSFAVATLVAASLAALTACGEDRSVNPVSEFVDGTAGAITTASMISGEYNLQVGQSVRIVPQSTSRTSRLKWSSTNSSVATVNSQGTVTARAAGSATVTVSGSRVLESYAVGVAAPAATLTNFSLLPGTTVSVTAGQSQQFSTTQSWSDGATRTSGVTYTATGGTINSSGLFTAGNLAGTFMVIASCTCVTPAVADTTVVTVNAVAQLTKLTISPKTVSLNAGAGQQFTVTANWSTGATTVPPVTWSATGGTVSSTGGYMSPTTAGTYRVIVAHTGGTMRDTALVTVTGSTPAPIPTGSLLFQDGFDNGAKTNANGFLWSPGKNVNISNARAFSGSHSLEFVYEADPVGSDSHSEQRFDFGRYLKEVWIEYMIYVPSNFAHRNDLPNNNKFLMLWKDNYGSLQGSWQIGMEYTRQDDTRSFLRFLSSRWDYNYVASNGPWPIAPASSVPLIGPSTIRPGECNKVQFHTRAASSRTSEDGVVEIHINGTMLFSYYRGRFHNFDPAVGDAALRQGYLMGWANSGYSQETRFYVDDFRVYTSNPGW